MSIRDQRQREAYQAWLCTGMLNAGVTNVFRGTIEGATGSGKTRVGLLAVGAVRNHGGSVVIAVPTTKLRDIDWPQEAREVGVDLSGVTLICHASLHTLKDQVIDLLVLDEGHHFTDRRSVVMKQNTVRDVMCLTATYPDVDDPNFKNLDPIAPVVYRYPLDQAVADGAAADYEMYVVLCDLDDEEKYIQAGSKTKGYYDQTERKAYDRLTRLIVRASIDRDYELKEVMERKRARMLYELRSKTRLARQLLDVMKEYRVLCFCGSIEQAESLLGDQVYHSQLKPVFEIREDHRGKPRRVKVQEADWAYRDFLKMHFNHLACCKALDEGVNIPGLQVALILSASSVKRQMIQRMGRVLRPRDGHTGLVIVLVAKDTVDEGWLDAAIEGLDRDKIRYITSDALLKAIAEQAAADQS